MFLNLEAEIVRNRVDKSNIAKTIGKTYGTLLQKLSGKSPLTYDEAVAIQEAHFRNIDIKYLFEKTEQDERTKQAIGN